MSCVCVYVGRALELKSLHCEILDKRKKKNRVLGKTTGRPHLMPEKGKQADRLLVYQNMENK